MIGVTLVEQNSITGKNETNQVHQRPADWKSDRRLHRWSELRTHRSELRCRQGCNFLAEDYH